MTGESANDYLLIPSTPGYTLMACLACGLVVMNDRGARAHHAVFHEWMESRATALGAVNRDEWWKRVEAEAMNDQLRDFWERGKQD